MNKMNEKYRGFVECIDKLQNVCDIARKRGVLQYIYIYISRLLHNIMACATYHACSIYNTRRTLEVKERALHSPLLKTKVQSLVPARL